MREAIGAILALVLVGCLSMSAHAQNGAPPPCSAPEFREMDFWLGEWDARWDASPNQPAGQGTNTITREFGNCVIQEHFVGDASTGNIVGHSVSTYHAGSGRWRQTWVDNQGSYIALDGNPDGDKFVLFSRRLADNVPTARMVFEDITPQAFTWRWQSSTDAGATWTDTWVIHYTRRAG